MRRKLFSLSAAGQHGHYAIVKTNIIALHDDNNVIRLIGKKANVLYVADLEYEEALVAEETSNNNDNSNNKKYETENKFQELWHQRMGHPNEKYLIQTANATEGMGGFRTSRKNVNVAGQVNFIGQTISGQACCIGKHSSPTTP